MVVTVGRREERGMRGNAMVPRTWLRGKVGPGAPPPAGQLTRCPAVAPPYEPPACLTRASMRCRRFVARSETGPTESGSPASRRTGRRPAGALRRRRTSPFYRHPGAEEADRV